MEKINSWRRKPPGDSTPSDRATSANSEIGFSFSSLRCITFTSSDLPKGKTSTLIRIDSNWPTSRKHFGLLGRNSLRSSAGVRLYLYLLEPSTPSAGLIPVNQQNRLALQAPFLTLE